MFTDFNGDAMKRFLFAFILIAPLAQPVKKAESRTADGQWSGVCGYYDVPPRESLL